MIAIPVPISNVGPRRRRLLKPMVIGGFALVLWLIGQHNHITTIRQTTINVTTTTELPET